MFTWANQAAKASYQRHLKDTNIHVQLSINPGDFDPSGQTQPPCQNYFLDASTRYLDDNNTGLISQIQLCVDPDRLDVPTFSAVFYFLFHESFCHAFERGQTDLRVWPQREYSSPSDPFVEGWMEYVSLQVLERLLSNSRLSRFGGALPQRPPISFHRKLSIINHARECHGRRTLHRFGNDAVRRRRLGEEVAIGLCEQIMQLESDDSALQGLDLFVDLSAGLNLLHLNSDRRRTLVLELYRLLHMESGSKTLETALIDYRDAPTGGPLRFYRSILGSKS
jgi:hypothetical protein